MRVQLKGGQLTHVVCCLLLLTVVVLEWPRGIGQKGNNSDTKCSTLRPTFVLVGETVS